MNNELIKVTVKNDQQLVSARDLYKGLEIRTRFSLWVSQNFKEFEKGSDFQPVVITTPRENRGSIELQDYALTIDMAKQLCLLSRTQKGKWYHVQEDGSLKPVDYDKEVEEYYKKWRDNYGN